MKPAQRRAGAVVGLLALVFPGAALVAQQRGAPPQRGSPPGQDTPYILVTAFHAPSKQLAVEAADELRDRLKSEHSAKELYVLPKPGIEATLTASGYPVDSALNVADLMELARSMRGEYVTVGVVRKTGAGSAVHVDSRLLMKQGQQVITQPLPGIDAKDPGDAGKQVERAISDALKQIPQYKECLNAWRAQKYDEAAAKARASIALYPKAAWARICLLNSYSSAKNAPPDSIIRVANEILSTDSSSVLAMANLADALTAKGENDKAIDVLLRMYAQNPEKKTLDIIIAAVGKSAPAKGVPIVQNLLKENPGDVELTDILWKLQLGASRFKDAIATGEELVKLDTARANLDYFNRQIGAAQSDSNTAKVAELATKASQKFSKDGSFPTLVAQSNRKLGKFPEAMAAARAAIAIDQKNSDAWLFAVVLASDLNQSDTAFALAKQGIAAGADKAKLGQAVMPALGAIVKKAQSSNTRADWAEALKAAQEVDAFAPTANTKYFVGAAAFSIAADALGQLNELQKKKETYAQGCEEVKVVEDNFAIASMNMPAGGAVDKETAGKILGAINEYGKYIPQFKTTMKCK